MTNPITGEDIKAPFIAPKTPSAVIEHAFTVPMAIGVTGSVLSVIAAAGFWAPSSPWLHLLTGMSALCSTLAAQLGQMWHSRNIRDKVAIANGTTTNNNEQEKQP